MKIVCRGVSNEKFALSCLFYGSVYMCVCELVIHTALICLYHFQKRH